MHDFSSTHVDLPDHLAVRMRAFAQCIPDEDLAEDGREEAFHITVKYGLHTAHADAVAPLLRDEAPAWVRFGRTSIFPASETGQDYDVVKVDVDSPDLRRLNAKIAAALDHTETHPTYQPHATIAYVKAGRGEQFAGDGFLEGHEATFPHLTFSSKDETQTRLPFLGDVATNVQEAAMPAGRKTQGTEVAEAADRSHVYHHEHHHGAVHHSHAHYHEAEDEETRGNESYWMAQAHEDHTHCVKCGSDDRLCGHRSRAKAAASPKGPASSATMAESVSLSEAHTDRAKREVLLRIISPGLGASRDPKSGLPVYYTEAALQEAAPLFAGKKCFLNHATVAERRARPEGDITRWGATIKESWWDPAHKAPVGRTRVVNSNLWEAIELDPEEVACSIRAHGTGRVGMAEGQKVWLCEHIDAVHSVDFVTYAGARGGVIEILESDRAAVRFTAQEEREAEKDMLEDLTEADLREARPDLVAAITKGAKPAPVDLTEALRPYQERVQRAEERSADLERTLNNRDARGLVEQSLAACGLPLAAAARVRVQFAEATFGFEGAAYETDATLIEAVGTAATQEADYIKSVTGSESRRPITGMGAAAPPTAQPASGAAAKHGEGNRTALQEAQRRLDGLLAPRPAKGQGGGASEGDASLQSRMDALVSSGVKG